MYAPERMQEILDACLLCRLYVLIFIFWIIYVVLIDYGVFEATYIHILIKSTHALFMDDLPYTGVTDKSVPPCNLIKKYVIFDTFRYSHEINLCI